MTRIKGFLFGGTTGWVRIALTAFWLLILATPLLVLLVFLSLSFTDLPSVTELENPKNNEASPVLAADGSVLGRFYVENRVPVAFNDLGLHLEAALVSTEDERYYTHSGIDWRSMPRVVIKTAILRDESAGGGSTISQQLAKLLFTEQVSPNIWRRGIQKLKEWIIAVRLERKYTKEEIIAMYLNRYDFINGAQGIRAAAENYFNGKRPEDLEVQEAAMLIGMLKNASLYNPLRFPERTQRRRDQVLAQMLRNERIGQAEFDSLKNLPLGIEFTRQQHDDGLAPYFRMVLAEEAKALLAEEDYRKADGSAYDIYRDGLTFYTTLDPHLQRHAEEQARLHMAELQEDFFAHWRKLDPWTYKSPYSTTEVPVERRLASLQADIRKSDRYQRLRSTILLPAIRRVEERMDFRFSRNDREIARMIAEADGGQGSITDARRAGLISDEFADSHRRVMRLEEFAELRRAYEKLQRAVEEAFDTEVDMRVFTYANERKQTDTVMTPLDSIKYHKMILQIGTISVEPNTGFVRSWVGGSDFKWFQYDHVTTNRQVGSTFKPFIYAASIDLRGISPCQRVLDQPVTIGPGDGNFTMLKPWTPRNSTGQYSYEEYTLYRGLKNSVNTISAYLMKELASTEPVRSMVSNMGIPKADIPDAPSIALGSVDLTVLELTGAYTTFGNNGAYIKPVYLTRIEDRSGQVIYEYTPETRQAISPEANYVMVNMLSRASVGNLAGVAGPKGGKTGTTNDQTDGWYMGLTPELIVGTWVGGDNRWIRFRSLALGAGSNMAKPFFRGFVREAQRDENVAWDTEKTWHKPDGPIGIEMNCEAYASDNDDVLESNTIYDDDPFGNTPDF